MPPWLSDSEELHLSKPRGLPEVRRKGIVGHTLLALDDEVETADGIRISTRPRTWLDLARHLSLSELVCTGDELVRIPRFGLEGRSEPFATIGALRAMVGRHPNLQGIVRARAALDLMRVGSDSGPETLLRLAMCDAGLPEPELQLPLRPETPGSPTADLGYRRRRMAVQYDGGHHLLPAQILSDRRRDRAFESAGWTVLVLTRDDLADGFAGATARIKRTLRTAYLSPSSAAGFSNAD
ncbi:endonuclease domain-containing protein [Pseudarthrobacter sp. MM222]|uniref:endonuclease domain-containing protein n=1 Tax=Pseudarthrobacter sp. MM222 TaxID=3018929 RepID=UPI002FD5B471